MEIHSFPENIAASTIDQRMTVLSSRRANTLAFDVAGADAGAAAADVLAAGWPEAEDAGSLTDMRQTVTTPLPASKD